MSTQFTIGQAMEYADLRTDRDTLRRQRDELRDAAKAALAHIELGTPVLAAKVLREAIRQAEEQSIAAAESTAEVKA